MSGPADGSLVFRYGVAAYHRGDYYEAHEHWELLWRDEPDGPRRSFLQGLIQVAAALHKLAVMKSPSGAIRLFQKAREHLSRAPDGMAGVDVKAVIEGIDRALLALPQRGTERTDVDPDWLPPLGPAPN